MVENKSGDESDSGRNSGKWAVLLGGVPMSGASAWC